MQKIILASDHGGFELKNKVAQILTGAGHTITDLGVYSPDSVDYPDIAQNAAATFLKGGYDFGILVCGTGIGISIAANKIHGIRCALIHDCFTAEMARAHNNANFIALGGRVVYHEPLEKILASFVQSNHQGGRHQTRIDKIHRLER